MDEPPTIRLTLRVDSRKFVRTCKGAEARLSNIDKPRTTNALRRLLDPASVVRKALGEFDR